MVDKDMRLATLSPNAASLWAHLRSEPRTINKLKELTGKSDKMVRIYLNQLNQRGLIKKIPTTTKEHLYASIDYMPVIDPGQYDSRPLEQRWQVFSPYNRRNYTLGELALAYGIEADVASIKAAELIVKAPAWLTYLAQEKELKPNEKLNQLTKLRDVIQEGIDQLKSAITVLTQFITDPRYWKPEFLENFNGSPDFPLTKDLKLIIDRLRKENEDQEG